MSKITTTKTGKIHLLESLWTQRFWVGTAGYPEDPSRPQAQVLTVLFVALDLPAILVLGHWDSLQLAQLHALVWRKLSWTKKLCLFAADTLTSSLDHFPNNYEYLSSRGTFQSIPSCPWQKQNKKHPQFSACLWFQPRAAYLWLSIHIACQNCDMYCLAAPHLHSYAAGVPVKFQSLLKFRFLEEQMTPEAAKPKPSQKECQTRNCRDPQGESRFIFQMTADWVGKVGWGKIMGT